MGHHSNWTMCIINIFRVEKFSFNRDFLSLTSYFNMLLLSVLHRDSFSILKSVKIESLVFSPFYPSKTRFLHLDQVFPSLIILLLKKLLKTVIVGNWRFS